MAKGNGRRRHSYVRFFFDDWAGGTQRMARPVRSVFFDVCLYNWDKAEPMPDAEALLAFSDLGTQGDDILAALVAAGKLDHDERGYFNSRAIGEAEYAMGQWAARSQGGKARQGKSGEADAEESSETAEAAPAPKRGAKRTFNTQSVVDAWNAMAKANGLSAVKSLTPARRALLNAALAEYGEAAVIAGIRILPESPFLLGGGERRWKASFDWFVKLDSCAKVIEGHTDYFPDAEKERPATAPKRYEPETEQEIMRSISFWRTQPNGEEKIRELDAKLRALAE